MTYTAESGVHHNAISVLVYADEFMPLLKVINRAIARPEEFELTDKELNAIRSFQDDFTDVAFEYGK